MLQRDYIMRIISMFFEAIRRSWQQAKVDDDPRGAADSLETLIGDATEIDGSILLSLEPESMASIVQVSGTDPRVTEFIVRSLVLVADYLDAAGDGALADLRRAQAAALADAYGIDVPTVEDAVDLEDGPTASL